MTVVASWSGCDNKDEVVMMFDGAWIVSLERGGCDESRNGGGVVLNTAVWWWWRVAGVGG